MNTRRPFWSFDSWGSAFPPKNADEIIDAVNDYLETFLEKNGNEAAEMESETLWEKFCATDSVCGVTAEYDD